MAKTPQIKDMRSRVQLVNAQQSKQANNPGILITYIPISTVYGDLAPVRPHLFIGQDQLDIEVSQTTHRLFIRWQDSIDIFDTVIRDTYKPDTSIRREIFRVLGVNDMDNQRRFIRIDLQLQKSFNYPYQAIAADTGNLTDRATATVS